MNVRKLGLVILFLAFLLSVGQSPQSVSAAATNYYIDSVNGSDGNSGTSSNKPWKSLANVSDRNFQPGDIVNFKRGSTWVGEMSIRASGLQGKPITFQDYGTGAAPVISNPGQGNRAIRIYSSWVVVQGFLLKDTGEAALEIVAGGNHNVIQNIEVTNAGMGVSIGGQFNLVTNNYAHDLKMVVNTPGGDDDYGAFGFLILNSDNEVSFNRCVNCRATSYDYGYDGGVIEIYGNGDNAYIHNNYGQNSNGFMEVGGAVARNVRVAYNISDNNYADFICLHIGGTFGSTIDNFRIENNTIVNTAVGGWQVIDCAYATLSASQFIFRNNIVYSNMNVSSQSTFTHTDNIYYMTGGATVGFPLGSGEQVSNPLFVNVSGGNYRLQSASPAINSGVYLGYVIDYEQNSVPQGGSPDIGAFEYARATSGGSSGTARLYLPFVIR
ncbi:MAG: hemolysin-type calcium-binding region [Chloroflexi bacterium]|nr:hemolysin-type calcium-binding region [Chloroflexota bacterium]